MTDWAAVAAEAASRYGIDADTFVAQMNAESGLQPGKTSGAGAQGIAQIMPATAKGWGVDPNDPHAALNAAAKAMSKYLKNYKGDWRKALAAYNAGPGAVQKYGGVPPFDETRNYISKILKGRDAVTPTARSSSRIPAQESVASNPDVDALEFIFKGSPYEGLATQKYAQATVPARAPARPAQRRTDPANGASGIPARRKNETGQEYLDRIATSMFGLKHDAGNAQTTGGNHKGRGHDDGRATDFGDAKNDPADLAAFDDYLDRNAKALGLKFSWYGSEDDPSGVHNNHVHGETLRSARGIRAGQRIIP